MDDVFGMASVHRNFLSGSFVRVANLRFSGRPRVLPTRRFNAQGKNETKTEMVNTQLLDPRIVKLANFIETSWVEHCTGIVLDPERDRFKYKESPRFTLENRLYTSDVFRRLHLELATGEKGLQVLHVVMYPWPAYELPIFSMDVVSFGVRLTHNSTSAF